MIRRSRVVIVICPALRGHGACDRAAGACRADRERARLRRKTRRRPSRPRRSARQFGFAATRRSSCTPERSKRIRGSTCCSRRWRRARGTGRTRGCCWPAGSPIRWRARAQATACRHRSGDGIRRRAAGRRDPGVSARRCDVLVSPRSRGTNTPLKIYQYLRSGKPIVATRLLTHTQVLER